MSIDNRKKKKYSILFVFVLVQIFLLPGCEAREYEGRGADPEQEPVSVSLICDVNFWEPPFWSTEPGTITGEITERTGVALDSIIIPQQNADTQISLLLLKDQLPDIISVTNSTTISQIVSSGKVWELGEFLEQYCPESHLLQSFPEDIKQELMKRDGGWYALSSHINSRDSRTHWKPSGSFYEELTLYNDNNTIIWNKSLLAKAGIDADDIRTEDQVLEVMRKVRDMNLMVDGETVVPLLIDGKDFIDPTLQFLMNSFGAEYVDNEGKYRNILLDEHAKRAVLYLNTMVREGYVYPEQLVYENVTVKQLLDSGRVLCFIGNIANTGIRLEEWESSGPVFSNTGEKPVLGKNLRASTGWISTFVSKDCGNPEKIAAWIDFMTSDEGMLLWNYGFEGNGYELTPERLVIQTEAGKQDSDNYRQTGQGAWWMFSNTSWARSILAEPETDSTEYLEKTLYTAYGTHPETVIYDKSLLPLGVDAIPPENREMREKEKQIETYWGTQILQVILAETKEEAQRQYDIMLEKMKDMGIEELDRYKNGLYIGNAAEYGKTVQKVNPELGVWNEED